MPEGPSLVIAKEAIAIFNRKKILAVTGNAKIDTGRLENKTIRAIKTWGKHLLICFDGFYMRIHLLMFGTYLVNDAKNKPLKLGLMFKKDQLNFYTCAVRLEDIMSDAWDAKKALKKLKAQPGEMICDALLDQEIFSGLGNIIKNEILYNTCIHPKSIAGKMPAAKTKELITEAVRYSFDFLKWKKEATLQKHWQAYVKKTCPRCNIPFHKEHTGTKKRRSFFCDNCQRLYV